MSDPSSPSTPPPTRRRGARSPRTVRVLVGAALLLAAGAGVAQVPQMRGLRGYRDGLPEGRNGFSFCRLRYSSATREQGGQGWSTDYPTADYNIMFRVAELTSLGISRGGDGEPAHAVIRATDSELFECPFLYASDVGTIGLRDDEVERLREYLQKGGFLWVDDFWGDQAWRRWTTEIGRVLPGSPIVDLDAGHQLFSTLYFVKKLPQIPSIQHWRRSGGGTSERYAESEVPHLRGIFDDTGRLLVLMSHNTDIADGWEREGEEEEFFYRFSPDAYALGFNILIWAMTH